MRIAEQVVQGLEHAHDRGIIHRDLKPGNVWLTDDGTAKIGDFGLAVALDRSPPDDGRDDGRHRRLHAAGAGAWAAAGRALRPLLAGLRRVRDGDRPPAVPGRRPGGDHLAAHQHRAGRAVLAQPGGAPRPRVADPAPAGEGPRRAAGERRRGPAGAGGDRGHRRRRRRRSRPESDVNPLDRLAPGIFVGREKEMDELRAGLEDALSGRGRLVMLVGEPGIGKTRTSEEFATYARLRDVQVLWGRCYEGEGAPAYWPWVQIIRAYVHDHEPKELMSEMGPGAADIAQVVSEVGSGCRACPRRRRWSRSRRASGCSTASRPS